jgi:hypothetical protein
MHIYVLWLSEKVYIVSLSQTVNYFFLVIIAPGSHVEYPTGTKNRHVVEDHPRNIPAKFGSNWSRCVGEEAWNVKSLDDGQRTPSDGNSSSAGLSLALDPMRKMFQNASSLNLQPLGQFKPNCPRMIIGRFSAKFAFCMPIGNPRWPPLQEIY